LGTCNNDTLLESRRLSYKAHISKPGTISQNRREKRLTLPTQLTSINANPLLFVTTPAAFDHAERLKDASS
jgi:hypothetical protein